MPCVASFVDSRASVLLQIARTKHASLFNCMQTRQHTGKGRLDKIQYLVCLTSRLPEMIQRDALARICKPYSALHFHNSAKERESNADQGRRDSSLGQNTCVQAGGSISMGDARTRLEETRRRNIQLVLVPMSGFTSPVLSGKCLGACHREKESDAAKHTLVKVVATRTKGADT